MEAKDEPDSVRQHPPLMGRAGVGSLLAEAADSRCPWRFMGRQNQS